MTDEKQENPDPLSRLIEEVFLIRGKDLHGVVEHARNFTALIEKADPFIQKNTEEVCPECRKVCCINRHSHHTHFDVLCLRALGQKIPCHRAGIADSEPCQFLSARGCRLERPLRPYRCTWYFCTPLLDHMLNAPVREYRSFVSCLEQISGERELLLTAFLEIAKEASLITDIPRHQFY